MARYREQILGQLASFGIFPKSETLPQLARDFLKALYTFEVRQARIRQQQLERLEKPENRGAYTAQILGLREKYAVLSVPVEWWVGREG